MTNQTTPAAGDKPQPRLIRVLFPTNVIGLVRHYGNRYPVTVHEIRPDDSVDADVAPVEFATESALRQHVARAEQLGKQVAISVAA